MADCPLLDDSARATITDIEARLGKIPAYTDNRAIVQELRKNAIHALGRQIEGLQFGNATLLKRQREVDRSLRDARAALEDAKRSEGATSETKRSGNKTVYWALIVFAVSIIYFAYQPEVSNSIRWFFKLIFGWL